MSNAFLPPELVQVIFETAITLSESTSVTINLIGVCRAVQAWLEPSLYHTVAILDSETATKFCSSIQSRRERDPSTSFLATHVKEFTLNWDIDETLISQIFGACTNIQSLYITRLSHRPKDHTCIDSVERAVSSLRPKCIILNGAYVGHFFPTIQTATHFWLDIAQTGVTGCCQNGPFPGDSGPFGDAFPSLTHAMLPWTSSNYDSAEDNRGDSSTTTVSYVCERLMSEIRTLKVLVIVPYPYLVNTLAVEKSWRADWVRGVQDPRCIRLLPGTDSSDFVEGGLLPSVIPRLLRTKMEIWEFAEREVALRKSERRAIPPEYMVHSTRQDTGCLIM